MYIYLVRHGQTLFNLKNRIQGWCDSPLTNDGINQAITLGKGLNNIEFVNAYASTSERAIDTANYILKDRDLDVVSLKGLKEINFGSLEGEYEDDVLAKDGSTHDQGFVQYGGETIQLTKQRIVKTLESIANENPEGNVLVVSHGGAIMCGLLELSQLDIQEFRNGNHYIGNCSVTIIEYTKDKVEVIKIADTSFIEEKGE